ncbi:hypothetical protein FGO68_gene17539 [Halteria grandinella]|uniref:Uncharacterized protein n=1 Tax=Halteria grandinella TaxID=5974 RepID=A0A8J8TAX8_HALGN|nr:hypothetical protein FGO68_gene17539 [Halteria grandinella]
MLNRIEPAPWIIVQQGCVTGMISKFQGFQLGQRYNVQKFSIPCNQSIVVKPPASPICKSPKQQLRYSNIPQS